MVGTAESDLSSVPGTPADTRRWYDHVSSLYALLFERLEAPPGRDAIEWLSLQPADVAVDLGCGAGGNVVAMAERVGEHGTVIGLDFAPGMCHETATSIRSASVENRASVACADVTETPLRTNSVDALLSSFVFDLLSVADVRAALDEASRILGPDGRLATVTLAQSDAVATRLYEGLHRSFPRRIDCRPFPIRTFLEDAGFRIERSRDRSLYGLPVTIALATTH
ncbi:MAG: class I SAM-dependent methyltransferase [Halanaeroarchaeum sp.]